MDNVAMTAQQRAVGIRQLKDSLSEQLRRVRSGETVLITDRGREIARIVPAGVSDGLLEMARRGEVVLPSAPRRRVRPAPYRKGEPLLSDIIIADRHR